MMGAPCCQPFQFLSQNCLMVSHFWAATVYRHRSGLRMGIGMVFTPTAGRAQSRTRIHGRSHESTCGAARCDPRATSYLRCRSSTSNPRLGRPHADTAHYVSTDLACSNTTLIVADIGTGQKATYCWAALQLLCQRLRGLTPMSAPRRNRSHCCEWADVC